MKEGALVLHDITYERRLDTRNIANNAHSSRETVSICSLSSLNRDYPLLYNV